LGESRQEIVEIFTARYSHGVNFKMLDKNNEFKMMMDLIDGWPNPNPWVA